MSIKNDESGKSIKLNVVELPSRLSSRYVDGHHSFFHPQPEQSDPRSSISSSNSSTEAPERKLTLFALRLAILERAATRLGTFAFLWATVVLLGGFAVTLKAKDFWYVTVIVFIESNRILFRSHEMEWRHQATWTLRGSLVGRSFRALKLSSRKTFDRVVKAIFRPFESCQDRSRASTDSSSRARRAENQVVEEQPQQSPSQPPDAPILPYIGWGFVSKNVSRVLSWLQIAAAFTCVGLSLERLIMHDFGEVTPESRNRGQALVLFYALAVAEAVFFLIEKGYWTVRIDFQKLLLNVSEECELGESGVVSLTRFFYDTYSKCIDGSIFDGVKMDLVTFAKELLDSEFREEQLMGIRMLQKFAASKRFANDTLRKIGTSAWVMERLIEMLSWKSTSEGEIRTCAAEIVSKLAGKRQNALRVGAIPGALESISSLLYTGRSSSHKPHEISERSVVVDQRDYEFSSFNLLGLLILKKLANDHDNCGKIGNTRGLLSKIVDLTSASSRLLWNERAPDSQIRIVKRSLQVLKKLASTTGNTGKNLRKEIAEIVFAVSNIRDILQYGQSHMVLQKLGIDILTALGADEYAKEHIGSTGGIIKLLFSMFFKLVLTDDEIYLTNEVGEALAIIALESKKNCHRILRVPNVLQNLIDRLDDPYFQINASRILRNLCAYSSSDKSESLKGVVAALPTVLKSVMGAKGKLLEVSIGLSTQICKLADTSELVEGFNKAGIKESDLVQRLVQILKENYNPELDVPRMRRFIIEHAIWMMRSNRNNIRLFKSFEMDSVLESVEETTSELECFHIFSGSVGLSRHSKTVSTLVETALELLTESESEEDK